MGWFDEQIKQRLREDEADFSRVVAELSGVVMGADAARAAGAAENARDAIGEILRYYHVAETELPANLEALNDQLEYLLRPAGVMRRRVALTGAWYKDATGAMLGRTRQGDTVALLPSKRGYTFFSPLAGERVRVTKKTAPMLAQEAICFYKPLPLKKIGVRELLSYMAETLSAADIAMTALCTLAATLLGMLMPYMNRILFERIIPSGRPGLLWNVACVLLGVMLSSALINITKALILGRIQTKMSMAVQSAAMMRVLSLPADFFKQYSAGELSTRTQSINSLSIMLVNAILSTGLTSIFSLAYILQIARFAPGLVAPALIVILVTVLTSLLATFLQMRISKARMEAGAKQDGLVFALFSGIQKIKLAGAERRAFTKWARSYKNVAALTYDPPFFLKVNAALVTAATLLGTVAIYYFAAVSRVSVADYMAFNTAYGMVNGAFTTLAGMAMLFANIRSTLSMAEPILAAVPEVSTGKKMLTRVNGGIEVSHVSFRYREDMPLILDDFSLHIRPGQYVAVVGKTGCGKSTLVRLLLGFEQPQKGAVYYDGQDISAVELRSLRRRIGVVMQNGKLFQGDIFSNITISAPWLTLEDAWAAAEMAGIADDVKAMPMGMHTIISEGSGGISGGQRQRLMIARAVAPKPRVLIFDEATSALDNITQKKVAESLDALKCTRIVIAHRLSTIRHCDRILVLENGKIVEDGSYDELIRQNGFFAALVARQRLETEKTENEAETPNNGKI